MLPGKFCTITPKNAHFCAFWKQVLDNTVFTFFIFRVWRGGHGTVPPLRTLVMAMLTWKEIPCVQNLQITYCVNCHKANIPGYCCQRSVFNDCYRNMGHFLCSVERIKSFVNVHLHCIVSNVPFKGHKYPGPPEQLRSEISFSRTCNIPK